MTRAGSIWRPRVFDVGTEPDPRFSLANERTLLAWLRTGLAWQAGGVALAAVDLPIHPAAKLVAAVLLLLLGIASVMHGLRTWMRSEHALRTDQPLPHSRSAVAIVLGGALSGAVLLLGLAIGP
ncbi:putative membrane protein [Nocardioides albertanoniae]|uniref:Putative membrane protein n=1 Tax=Nocardioides albertanoniae TaxID=1175486 RepID=A0A543A1G2_9ACTN|nr:DUF202 domain-containing protein [Nocardioides albertanoniae]TQL66394.1 putative membrane protein [Nocardioides albertanoniae]